MSEEVSKVCTQCEVEKPLDEFYTTTRRNKVSISAACKGCYNKDWKKYYSAERCKKSRLKTKYGLTEEEFDSLYDQQQGRCAICGKGLLRSGEQKDKMDIAHVDHNHETGQIRGLLCSACNMGLGMFKDSSTLLWNALKYMEKYDEC